MWPQNPESSKDAANLGGDRSVDSFETRVLIFPCLATMLQITIVRIRRNYNKKHGYDSAMHHKNHKHVKLTSQIIKPRLPISYVRKYFFNPPNRLQVLKFRPITRRPFCQRLISE